jgi:hypothetical protein
VALDVLEHLDLAIPGRHLADRADLFRRRVVVELGPVDVIGRNDSLERRLDHFARRGGDHIKREAAAVDSAFQELDELRDMVLEPHPPAGLDEVLPPHPPELRVVPDQIGELPALMDEVAPAQAVHLRLETGHAEQVGQHGARIVEAERLVEVRGQQIVISAV